MREKRNNFIHSDLKDSDLFADAQLAEKAISSFRKGIKKIYTEIGKIRSLWVDCDTVLGRFDGSSATVSVIRAAPTRALSEFG